MIDRRMIWSHSDNERVKITKKKGATAHLFRPGGRCYKSGVVVGEMGGRRLTLRYVPVRATVRLREVETARQLEHLEQEPISSGIFLKDLKSEE